MNGYEQKWELEAWLEKPGRTQASLAERLGVTQGAISQWLKKRRVPHKRVRKVEGETRIPAAKLNPDFARH